MQNSVGSFSVEDAFRITGRGWVLTGEAEGEVSTGCQLRFGNGVVLHIIGINLIKKHDTDKFGLLIRNQFESRQELIDQNIIGATAQIIE